ncbi:MAG: undecaprenyl-phosphate glucose phosphotransferase [Pseudomonadota bacterium]
MHGQLTKRPRSKGGHLRFTSNALRTLGIINDVACLVLAFVLATIAYDLVFGYYYDAQLHRSAAIIICINYLLIRISRDGYAPFRNPGRVVDLGAIADFILASVFMVLIVVQLGMRGEFSRGMALYFFVIAGFLLFASRLAFSRLLRSLLKREVIGQNVAIYAEGGNIAARVGEIVKLERLPQLRLIGYADERLRSEDRADNLEYLGGFSDLLALAQEGRLDQVILAVPSISQDRLDRITDALSAASIDLCVLPREAIELTTQYRVSFLGTLPVFAVWQQPIRDVDGVIKEALDYTLASVALLLLSPLFLLIALAIKLETKGPILFRQKRLGFNNNEITVLKFRSMFVATQDQSGQERTTRQDPRVTRVGRFIRRTSLDELPQLLNVLKGDMSIVGPRPHATMMKVGDKLYFDAVRGYAARHRVKPGITGLAQVRGLRGEIATQERARKRVELDTYYIENWTPWLDIQIILETVIKVVWDDHAY